MIAVRPLRFPESPPETADQLRRSALLCRLAGVLEDMRVRGLSAVDLGEDPVTWKDRADLDQLLDVWEAGEHPVQHS